MVANRCLQANHMRVLKRRQSLHFDAVSYLIESLSFSYEILRNVVLSQVALRAIRCLRQVGSLGVLRGVVPWLLGGREHPWLSAAVFRRVWLCWYLL